MTRELSPENCATRNNCVMTIVNGAECGSRPEHLLPQTPVEALCYEALRGRLAAEADAQPLPFWGNWARKDTELAWQEAEVALHPQTPGRPRPPLGVGNESDREGLLSADDHFGRAEDHAGRVVRNKMRLFQDGLSAEQLLLHLPVLRLKREGEPWPANELTRIRSGVGAFVDAAHTAEVHPGAKRNEVRHPGIIDPKKHRACFFQESDRLNTLTVLGGQLLCLRAGLPVLPSSVREMGRFSATPHPRSHNLYIPGEASKLPLKVGFAPQSEKTASYNKFGLYVAFGGLVKRGAESVFGNPLRTPAEIATQTAVIIKALSREAQQREISDFQCRVLGVMTTVLQAQVRACAQNSYHPFTMKAEGLAFPA